MAKMIDQLPDYIGEQMVWHAFSDNLPNHFIVYNSRTIQGDEYDFCILVENMGIFIVEVKGWFPENVINVVSPKSIYIEGYSKALGSPLNQARSYMFNMINHLQDDMGINPLLMSMVCYPRISKEEYYKKRLNIVSDEIETIFAEDLQNPQMLLSKFKTKYKNDVVKHADVLDHKMYMLVRHDFEPNFDLKEKAEELNPSYSRLRIIVNSLSAEQIQEIKDEYFTGIKEIVFFNDRDNYEELIKSVDEEFRQRNLKAERGNIVIGTNSLNISSRSEYSIFNLSASEMYRLILNGYYSSKSSIANLDGDTLLNENPTNDNPNGHCSEWNDLKNRLNSKDGYDFIGSILDYYNLTQGDTTKNEYLNRTQFNKDVRDVIKTGLLFTKDDVQIDDPISKRKKYSEILLDEIVAKIPSVVAKEKDEIQKQLGLCKQFIDLKEMDSAEFIEDIADDITKFYKGAQDNSISIIVKYDPRRVKALKNNAASIYTAINNAQVILDTEDVPTALLLMSKDPLFKIKEFTAVLEETSKALQIARSEVNTRMAKEVKGDPDDLRMQTLENQINESTSVSCR